jgi:hypothetical protein
MSSATQPVSARPDVDLAPLVALEGHIPLAADLGVGTTIVAVTVARVRLRVVPRAREVISHTERLEVVVHGLRDLKTELCRTCVRIRSRTVASMSATYPTMSSGII